MRRACRSGFTVLELLCALGILAVLLAIAVPRVSASLPGLLADQAVRRLAADVQLARVKAISRNGRVRAVMQLDAATYVIEADVEGQFVAEGEPRRLPSGVAFDASASSRVVANRVSITFQPRGHTADNATIAIVASNGAARRVIVSPAGRVRIE